MDFTLSERQRHYRGRVRDFLDHRARPHDEDCKAQSNGNKEARNEISTIKVKAPKMALRILDDAIQTYGGIGMTWELPLSNHAKRLTVIGLELGDDDHHLERYVALGT